MACECVGDDLLFRYEVSGQGASCGVSQMGGGPPISNNHIVINLDEKVPDDTVAKIAQIKGTIRTRTFRKE